MGSYTETPDIQVKKEPVDPVDESGRVRNDAYKCIDHRRFDSQEYDRLKAKYMEHATWKGRTLDSGMKMRKRNAGWTRLSKYPMADAMAKNMVLCKDRSGLFRLLSKVEHYETFPDTPNPPDYLLGVDSSSKGGVSEVIDLADDDDQVIDVEAESSEGADSSSAKASEPRVKVEPQVPQPMVTDSVESEAHRPKRSVGRPRKTTSSQAPKTKPKSKPKAAKAQPRPKPKPFSIAASVTSTWDDDDDVSLHEIMPKPPRSLPRSPAVDATVSTASLPLPLVAFPSVVSRSLPAVPSSSSAVDAPSLSASEHSTATAMPVSVSTTSSLSLISSIYVDSDDETEPDKDLPAPNQSMDESQDHDSAPKSVYAKQDSDKAKQGRKRKSASQQQDSLASKRKNALTRKIMEETTALATQLAAFYVVNKETSVVAIHKACPQLYNARVLSLVLQNPEHVPLGAAGIFYLLVLSSDVKRDQNLANCDDIKPTQVLACLREAVAIKPRTTSSQLVHWDQAIDTILHGSHDPMGKIWKLATEGKRERFFFDNWQPEFVSERLPKATTRPWHVVDMLATHAWTRWQLANGLVYVTRCILASGTSRQEMLEQIKSLIALPDHLMVSKYPQDRGYRSGRRCYLSLLLVLVALLPLTGHVLPGWSMANYADDIMSNIYSVCELRWNSEE